MSVFKNRNSRSLVLLKGIVASTGLAEITQDSKELNDSELKDPMVMDGNPLKYHWWKLVFW